LPRTLHPALASFTSHTRRTSAHTPHPNRARTHPTRTHTAPLTHLSGSRPQIRGRKSGAGSGAGSGARILYMRLALPGIYGNDPTQHPASHAPRALCTLLPYKPHPSHLAQVRTPGTQGPDPGPGSGARICPAPCIPHSHPSLHTRRTSAHTPHPNSARTPHAHTPHPSHLSGSGAGSVARILYMRLALAPRVTCTARTLHAATL
jgi:hypothetical protein